MEDLDLMLHERAEIPQAVFLGAVDYIIERGDAVPVNSQEVDQMEQTVAGLRESAEQPQPVAKPAKGA